MRKFACAAAATALLTACNGIFEDLYDAPAETAEFGFVAVDEATHSGTIYLDATDYTQWHYVDLRNRRVTTAEIDAAAAAPASWDFAIHRYDAKTNGGAVADSGCETVAAARAAAGTLPATAYTPDEWTDDRILVDLSQMMEGIVRYAEDYRNPVLSAWLTVDTSTMPPLYTLSHRVYLLRLPDGSRAALRLTDYMNDAAVKGFLTIEYTYPL